MRSREAGFSMDRIVRPPSIFDRALWPDEPFDTTLSVVKIGTTTFETGFDAATATGAPCRYRTRCVHSCLSI